MPLLISGDRRGVEKCKLIVEPPMVRTRLFASTGDLQNVMENRLADLLNAGLPCRYGARIDIDQIGPAFGERRS